MRIGPGDSAWTQTQRARDVRIAVHDDEPRLRKRRSERTISRRARLRRARSRAIATACAASRGFILRMDLEERAESRRFSSILPRPGEGLQCAPAMGATVNLTHHFLIAMPDMADPHFAHTLTYVCEHNPGRRARHRRQPADRHDAVDAVRADRGAARRRRRCARRRCISAAPCRSTAASCCIARSATGSRRSRSATTSGSPRRRTCSRPSAAARARETCSSRSATRAGRRDSSSRSSRRTPGSPSRPTPSVLFELAAGAPAARGDAAARHRLLAPVRGRRARMMNGADRSTAGIAVPSDARSHGARVRFRHAAHRRRGRQHARRASRIRSTTIDGDANDDALRRDRGADRRMAARRSSSSAFPVHADGARARDDGACASASRASSRAASACRSSHVDERYTTRGARKSQLAAGRATAGARPRDCATRSPRS